VIGDVVVHDRLVCLRTEHLPAMRQQPIAQASPCHDTFLEVTSVDTDRSERERGVYLIEGEDPRRSALNDSTPAALLSSAPCLRFFGGFAGMSALMESKVPLLHQQPELQTFCSDEWMTNATLFAELTFGLKVPSDGRENTWTAQVQSGREVETPSQVPAARPPNARPPHAPSSAHFSAGPPSAPEALMLVPSEASRISVRMTLAPIQKTRALSGPECSQVRYNSPQASIAAQPELAPNPNKMARRGKRYAARELRLASCGGPGLDQPRTPAPSSSRHCIVTAAPGGRLPPAGAAGSHWQAQSAGHLARFSDIASPGHHAA
jgi:hypothetical protein